MSEPGVSAGAFDLNGGGSRVERNPVFHGYGKAKPALCALPPGQFASPLLTFALPEGITTTATYQRLLDKHHVVVKRCRASG